MIKITNVTKIYKSKKKGKHKALNNISFELPSKGIVFILGKSGSGKSTFLNLLGGLDSITEGKIIVDGNDISSLRESEFANYRNTHIGFIFQDYHLIDELNVYENIVLSLNLRREDDNGIVLSALEKVGLKGYENRFPDELSGGERQRVAIARAIVKKPRIILADEPTGNLDNNTGTQIIKLLKDLSSTCLIVVVSHNLNDASKYADRIIELSRGNVIADLERNRAYNDKLTYKDDTIIYPGDLVLSKDDVVDINKHLSTGKYKKVLRIYDKFIPIKKEQYKEEKHQIINRNLSKRNTAKFTLKFLKNKLFSILLTSFMVASVMTIFSLAGSFVTFDSSKVINDKLKQNNISSISMDKLVDEEIAQQLTTSYRGEVGENDIATLTNANVGGTVRTIYNHTIPIVNSNNMLGLNRALDFSSSPIIYETLGTIYVEENIIQETYGELTYLALADTYNPAGVYISDYVADCILSTAPLYKGKGYTYSDIVSYYYASNATYKRSYINGIFKTNYLERYQDIFELYLSGQIKDYTDLFEREDFVNFTSEIYSLLGFNLTYNPNFVDDFVKENFSTVAYGQKFTFDNIEKNNTSTLNAFLDDEATMYFDLNDNEIVLSINLYNNIYGTEYTSTTAKDFVPHECDLKLYRFTDLKNEHPLINQRVKIVGIANISYCGYASDNIKQLIIKHNHFDYGLWLHNVSNITKAISLSEDMNYEQNNILVMSINTMSSVVDVFAPIFRLIALVLFIAVVFIFTSFAIKMIKAKMHDIGVLKALGSKNRTIVAIFGLQILLVALFTCLLTTIGYFLFADLTNKILISSLAKLAKGRVFQDLSFVSFNGMIIGLSSSITILLSIVSLVIPMIRIRKIKPVKIIKTKE